MSVVDEWCRDMNLHGRTSGESSAADLDRTVAILMCTHNGQRYLREQIDSISQQTHTVWQLWVSDDGSSDETLSILQSTQAILGGERLSIHDGPQCGFSANFLSLTCKSDVHADYYAYADQDDIWEPNKLQRAIEFLDAIPAGVPGLYCSRTRLVDSDNQEIGLSPLFQRPPSFRNALMQNIGGGNTMVFNQATRRLLDRAGRDVDVVTHDWWVYLVVTGAGGQVRYDPVPTVRYRQHDYNLVGMNSSWPARLKRIQLLWRGRFREINDRHIGALARIKTELTRENQFVLEIFDRARQGRLLPRIAGLWHARVYRQTLFGNLGLIFAAIFKKL